MESKSPPPVFDKEAKDNTEMEKLCEKLRRAYQRRDHYAQLYYKAMAQLEHTRWELSVANKKIQELQSLNLKGDHQPVNGASTSPVSSASSMNNIEVSEVDIKPSIAVSSPKSITPPNDIGKFSRSDFEQDTKVVNPSLKRVAFAENPPFPMIYTNDWVITPPTMQRSYSITEGEQISPGNLRAQRTQSFSFGKGIHAHPQYPIYPHIPPPQQLNSSFNLSSDHRLPRVRRGLTYESPIPSYQPPIQSNSAFKRVPVLIHPSDFRNQPHYGSLPLKSPRKKPLTEGGIWHVKNLNHSDLKLLFGEILNQKLELKKLEISTSGLGDVEVMALLCRELKKSHMHTIEELSLPYNDINKDSLKILLDTLSVCRNIKHLKLNGNDIEHHTHLLEQHLPQEFREELVVQENDNVVTDSSSLSHSVYSDHDSKISGSSSLPHNIKLLQI